MVSIKPATEADIPLIRSLAEKIWWPTYRTIIKEEQILYMLSNIYSEKNLLTGLKTGETFLLLHDKNGYQGFVSFTESKAFPKTWKINKLYVLPENHGAGYGRRLVGEVLDRARKDGIRSLILNVNRFNPALQFYKKLGFEIQKEEDVPIGPYWMNDYVMKLDF
jgi:diamine N-acetyltransferase